MAGSVQWVEDRGCSAKDLRRPGIREALRLLAAGDADALVVAKLDRLSRSLLDFSGLVEQSRRERWQLVALDLGVDTSTPSGEMLANVLASFAQFERRLIGQRTAEALRASKRRASGSGDRRCSRSRCASGSSTRGCRERPTPLSPRR